MLGYVALTLAVLPRAGVAGPEIPGITAAFVAGIVIAEATTAFLLLVQFHALRAWPLLLLGCAYLHSSLMAVFHLLTFPGAVLAGRGVIGTAPSTAWIFVAWILGHAGLSLAGIVVAVAAPGRCPAGRSGRAIQAAVATVLLAVAAIVLAAILIPDRLPDLMGRELAWTPLNIAANWLAIGMLAAGAALVLWVLRDRDALFLWLALAQTTMACALLVSQLGGGRYSVGWIVARAGWVTSAAVLFLFFLAQFVRQQRQLAHARDQLEARVAARTAELHQALGQRDLLLREVYHRVRNNLQVVDSLVRMEAKRQDNPAVAARLTGIRNQLHALGLVHAQLMRSDDLATFDIAPFLYELTSNLERSLSPFDDGVRIEVAADSVAVTMDIAAPLGLIVTELVTNAVRHAYPPGSTGSLAVGFHRVSGDAAELVVADQGRDPAAVERYAARPGLGSRIVEGLVGQLDGALAIAYQGGTRVTIRLPLPEGPR
ncbi:sensor histidine kinase [Dankookia sp. GCM10030260]|uniref:sensor histidine kinase n=1 Tax=Dankookia sp. GCM10030260 TaxID=3273390 RepID=UPI0036194353